MTYAPSATAQQDQNGYIFRSHAERIARTHSTTLIQLQHDEPGLRLSGDRVRVLHLRWALGY